MPTTGYGSALPPITIQAGITNSPLLTVPVTWTDISSYVQHVKIIRGRQHVLDQFEPGQAIIDCWRKNDNALDPLNSDSGYYPNLGLNTPIRVSVTFNQMTAAQTRAQAGSWTATTNCTVALTAGSATATGSVRMTASSAATMVAGTATGTSGFVVGSNVPVVLAATVTSGSSTNRSVTVTATWYNSAGASLGTSTVTGTQTSNAIALLGSAVTPAGTAFGAMSVTVTSASNGEIQMTTNVGVLMAQSTSAVTSSVYYDGGPQPLFTGFLDQLDPNYKSNVDTRPHIIASDAMRLLNDYTFSGLSYPGQVETDGAVNFWRFSDSPGSGVAVDLGSSPTNGTYSLDYTLGNASYSSGDGTTCAYFGVAGQMNASACGLSGTGAYTIELWFKCAAFPVNDCIMYYSAPNGAVGGGPAGGINIGGQVNGTIAVFTYDSNGTNILNPAATYNDGAWHYLALTRDATGKIYTLYIDNVQKAQATSGVTATVSSSQVWCGANSKIMSQTTGIQGNLADVAIYTSALSTTKLTDHYLRGLGGFTSGEISGSRINSALSLAGWPAAWIASTVSSTGNSPIQQPASSLTGSSVLTYIQAVALAENGYLYALESGAITFADRHAISTPVVLGTAGATVIGDAPSQNEILFKGQPDIGIDNTDFANGAAVTRTGGVTQTTTPTTTSVNSYGTKRYLVESGLLLTTDNESLARAQYDVNQYGTPHLRVRSIDIDVISSANPLAITSFAGAGSISPLGLTSTITFNRRPFTSNGFNDGHAVGSPLFSQLSMIEGIEHDINLETRTWTATLHCSAADTTKYWILGTSQLGTGTTLGY